jgi:hypothetical protein
MSARRGLHPLGALGLVALAAGLAAWLWLGSWRDAASGALVLFVCATVGAALDRRDR